jgi:outer membrane cobalamin receptor
MVRGVVLGGMFLFVALAARADDPPKPAKPPRVDVVITVEREAQDKEDAAAAVSVLRGDELAALPVESLGQALALVPGITMMFDSGTSGSPMITSRGFFGGGEVEYVKLLVDGVPVGDAESGSADWSRFRLDGIDRIEIVHGPGSAAWGDTALGGVIQIFTARGVTDKPGDLRLTAGSFGTRSAGLGYRSELHPGLLLGVRADLSSVDGFRDHASRSDQALRLTLDRILDTARWQVTLDGSRKDRREPGALTYAEIAADRAQSNRIFRFDREQTSRRRIAASYDAFGPNTLHLIAFGAWRDSDNLRSLLLAPGFGLTALRQLGTQELGATVDTTRELAHGSLHAGIDLGHTSLNGDYFGVGTSGEKQAALASADGHRQLAGLFVTATWNVCRRCRLSAGVRQDEIRDSFSNGSRHASATSPRAGLTVRAGKTSYFVQLSHAFKAPTLDQLFDPRPFPDFQGGTFIVSNPTLRPQRARNFEAGASGEQARAHWSLTAYRMNVTDEIDFDPQTFTYSNIGSSIHRGAEASVSLFSGARVTPAFTYAWTRVANAEVPGRQLKNIPEHVAQAIVEARLPGGVAANLVYRWMHGRWLDDAGVFPQSDVSRLDLRLARSFGPARVSLDLLNATDQKYDELGYVLADFQGNPTPLAFPAPGRSMRLGVTWKF